MLQNTELQLYYFEQVLRSGNKTNIMSTIIGYNYEAIFDIFIEIGCQNSTFGVNKLRTVLKNYLNIVSVMKAQNGMPPKINNAFVDSVLMKIARNDEKLLSYFDTTFTEFVTNPHFNTIVKLTAVAYLLSVANAPKTVQSSANSTSITDDSNSVTNGTKVKKLNGRQRKALKAKQEHEVVVVI